MIKVIHKDRFQSISDKYTTTTPKYVRSMDVFDMSREGIIHQNIRADLLLED